MHVLVGVEVGRIPTDKTAKHIELARRFVSEGGGIIQRNYVVQRYPVSGSERPLAEIQVKAEAEVRVLPAVSASFGARCPPHHKAGARQDAMLISLDYSPVHSEALAKVIAIDNQVLALRA